MSSEFNTGQVLFAGTTTAIRTVPLRIPIALLQITRDFLLELGLHYVLMTIDNNDAINILQFRTEEFGTLQTIPIQTRGTLTDEIHHFLQIIPNAVTGTGLVTVYLAPIEEIRRLGLVAS